MPPAHLDARDPGRHLAQEHSLSVKLEPAQLEAGQGALHGRLNLRDSKYFVIFWDSVHDGNVESFWRYLGCNH